MENFRMSASSGIKCFVAIQELKTNSW